MLNTETKRLKLYFFKKNTKSLRLFSSILPVMIPRNPYFSNYCRVLHFTLFQIHGRIQLVFKMFYLLITIRQLNNYYPRPRYKLCYFPPQTSYNVAHDDINPDTPAEVASNKQELLLANRYCREKGRTLLNFHSLKWFPFNSFATQIRVTGLECERKAVASRLLSFSCPVYV